MANSTLIQDAVRRGASIRIHGHQRAAVLPVLPRCELDERVVRGRTSARLPIVQYKNARLLTTRSTGVGFDGLLPIWVL